MAPRMHAGFGHWDGGYDDEQREFITAMNALKRRLGRMPSPAEILQEAIRLGYRKTERVTLAVALRQLRGRPRKS